METVAIEQKNLYYSWNLNTIGEKSVQKGIEIVMYAVQFYSVQSGNPGLLP